MRFVSCSFLLFLGLNACTVYSVAPASPAAVSRPAEFQEAFLSKINSVRAKGCNCGSTYMPPVPPLTWNYQLQNSALLHARDMNKRKYFSHTSQNGKSSKDRILEAGYEVKGYRSFAVGENIAWGQRSIDEVMTGWLKSEGHCRNIMNKSFREVGVAMENYYWVQNFGGRTNKK